MKVLFQGDSITDACRDKSDYHDLGQGYPKYAAPIIAERHPEIDFEFIDLGISGNQTKDLVDRLESDFVDIDPDIVSVMIGLNDTWHHAAEKDWIPNDVFEQRYRTVLEAIKTRTHAKLMMIEPFLIPVEDKLFFREDLDPKIQIVRKLAREYADVYIPLDGLLAAEFLKYNPTDIAGDGVHPSGLGAEIIGKIYADYFEALL